MNNSSSLKNSPGWLFVLFGIVEIILGIIACILPYAVGLSLIWIVGVLLLAVMLVRLYQVFASSRYRWWNLFGAIIYGLIGVMFIHNPIASLITVTVFLGWLFVFAGALRLGMSFSTKSGWQIFNGFITLLLGIIIITTPGVGALQILGILVGIDLIFSGWTLATMGTLANKTSADQ